jgi:dTDP-4-amino-4,6-dideoxygalactose transaminase
VPNRDNVQKQLAAVGVPTTVYYPVPMHQQVMFASLSTSADQLPVAEKAASEVLSLPIYSELSVEQLERVAEALRAVSAC